MTRDIDQILYRHLLQQTTEAEEKELFAWLEASDENRRFFFEIAAIWHAHRVLSSKELNERYTAMMHRLNARIDADEQMSSNVSALSIADEQMRKAVPVRSIADEAMRSAVPAHNKLRRTLLRLTAAAAIVAVAVTGWFTLRDTAHEAAFRTFLNNTEEIASLRLDDGTQVWLQAHTELRYDVGKSSGERIVRLLNGEAYFDVMHDAGHPFLVKTENLTVRVLGTAFNVRSIDADMCTEIVLERGSVRLQTPEGENLIRLHPNQKATYNAVSDDFEVEEVLAEHFVTQRYDLVAMKNAMIEEIILSVEKNFGVRLRVTDPTDSKRYNINYLRSNSLQEVVEIIEFMTGQQCEAIENP